jgi:hypothetical protein
MQAAGQEIAQVNKPLTAPDCKAENDNQRAIDLQV